MRESGIYSRINSALAGVTEKLSFYSLAHRVFPEDQYPNAMRYSNNGGPPGCYMPLSRALRRMQEKGLIVMWEEGVGPGHRFVRLSLRGKQVAKARREG